MFNSLYGEIASYFILPLLGTALTAVTAWGVQAFRRLGWAISETAAKQFQVAVTNAAGVVVNKLATGKGLKAEDVRAISWELAEKLLRNNMDTAKQLGIEGKVELVADKILDKAAGMSVNSPEPTVSVPEPTPVPVVKGSVPHRT